MALEITEFSLKGLLYGLYHKTPESLPFNELYDELIQSIDQSVKQSDPSIFEKTIQREPGLEAIEDLLFDLLAIEWFSKRSEEEDYPEIFEDYGSELLSVLMYLNDCYDNEVAAHVNDFLDMVSEGEMFGENEDLEHYMALYQWQEAIKEGPEALKLQLEEMEGEIEEDMLAIAWFFADETGKYFSKEEANYSAFTSAFFHALSSLYTSGANFTPNFVELFQIKQPT
jgi:hypothetical protein